LFWRITLMSVARMFMYKENTWVGMVTSMVYFIIQILFIYFLFAAGNIDYLAGFDRHEIYLVFAFSQLVVIFIFWFVSDNVRDMIKGIYQGRLDFFLLKPVDPRFLIMYQRFSGSFTISIVLYLLFLFPYLFYVHDFQLGIIAWMQIIYILLVSLVIYTILFWLAGLANFYWPNFQGMLLFINNIGEVNRYPKSIYPYVMQFLLTFIYPIFLVENPIYNVLDDSFSWELGVQMGLMTVILVMIFLILWKDGLRRYGSAA